MQILDNLIIVALHVLCFIAGLKLSDKYHRDAESMKKDALTQQFVRLKANADADDPVKPYAPRAIPIKEYQPSILKPINNLFNTGDTDGDDLRPITPEFMNHLKENGKAATKICKSDIAK